MGGKWERVEKMIEDQSVKCQGMIYHLDIRPVRLNALFPRSHFCLIFLTPGPRSDECRAPSGD